MMVRYAAVRAAPRNELQPGPPFVAVHLAQVGGVLGVTAAINPREIRAGQALITSRKVVDQAKNLADAGVPLQRLM